MSLKRIRRRLSQTFTRFHDGSLTELAEHLTIEENGGIRENASFHEGMKAHTSSATTPTFTRISRRLSLSNSRIFSDSHKQAFGHRAISILPYTSYGISFIYKDNRNNLRLIQNVRIIVVVASC
ncbi:uncharacterized protein LOC121878678 [Homarus americanus]|uniref:uncharacterized protein LOC121878678 n=1 Tax=Homarus americanus TaxID=6706 RepID=UPI001C485733|nr:uncharacterized protein LOC121878678 [Homarus americanus]